jgi:type VI secretion system secreted protein VgrG
VLDDTDARQPETDLQVDDRIAGEADGEMQEQGAKYRDVEQGRRLARVRAEEQAARRTVYRGRSDCPALHAGYRFVLDEHDRAAFNQAYLVVETVHAGSQRKALGLRGVHPSGRPPGFMDGPVDLPGTKRAEEGGEAGEEGEADTVYHNRFRCLPAQIPFRPERTTPVPRIPGVLTARVETTGGPYASLDADGWYRARMTFDRSGRAPGQATKPIRMVTPTSGPDYGLHFPNHAGTEMIVAFLHGDVDRPLALGTVPNRTQKSPVTASNRMQNVLRTFGGSELRMDDTIGAEQILLRSPAGRELRVDDDRERIHLGTPTGHRLHLDDRRKRVAVVTAAGHRLRLDDEEKTTSVRSAAGHRIQIDDAKDRIVVQDAEGRHAVTLDIAGNALRIETSGVLSLSAEDAVEITGRTVRIESAEQTTVEAGTHLSQRAGQDVAVEAGGAVSVEAVRDLALDAGAGASVSAREIGLDAQQAVSARGGASVQLRGNEVTIHGQSIADIRAALLKLNG